eukprot:3572550-Rhodomonas_salina.2
MNGTRFSNSYISGLSTCGDGTRYVASLWVLDSRGNPMQRIASATKCNSEQRQCSNAGGPLLFPRMCRAADSCSDPLAVKSLKKRLMKATSR